MFSLRFSRKFGLRFGFLWSGLLLASMPLSAQNQSAFVPILYISENGSRGLVLGATENRTWLEWKQTHPRIEGNETYRLYAAQKSAGEATGQKPELAQASGDAYYVPLGVEGKPALVALSGATWNPAPRKPKASKSPTKAERAGVIAALKAKGLKNPKPQIANVWRVDLEGDGVMESLIEANSPGFKTKARGDNSVASGDFSVIVLQKRVKGKMQNIFVDGIAIAKISKNNSALATPHALSHVLDLNGDGVLEVIVSWYYYEGGGANVYQVKNGQAKRVLEAADGA